jgi:dipeptidyl-peptidase-4
MLNTTDSIYPFAVPVEYPIAGEPPSPYKIGVVDIATAKTNWMSLPTDPVLQSYVPRMEWAGNSTQLILQHLNRKQNESNIMICDVVTGKSNSIYQRNGCCLDRCCQFLADKFWLNGGKEFMWTSEKDGWQHLYRIGRDGKNETLITKGNYDVMDVSAVDEPAAMFIFMQRLIMPRNVTSTAQNWMALELQNVCRLPTRMEHMVIRYRLQENLRNILSPIIIRLLQENG